MTHEKKVEDIAETLKYGLVPIIVPELKGITLGGAVSGCSVESASYRYGGFHDTCLSYEVITASGEIEECRTDGENSLLFQMMQGSFGTIGILSKLQFLLRETKPYVHIRYRHYTIIEEYRRAIEEFYRRGKDDFIDGIIHSEKQFTLCIGNFCIDYYRLIEKKLLEIKGIKTLISHNSYTREEFWKVWNKENYTRVKEYTDPQNIFRNLYEKTSG